jgi:hypothetical protein
MYRGSKDFHLFDDRAVVFVQKQPDTQALGLRQGDDLHTGGATPQCGPDPRHKFQGAVP